MSVALQRRFVCNGGLPKSQQDQLPELELEPPLLIVVVTPFETEMIELEKLDREIDVVELVTCAVTIVWLPTFTFLKVVLPPALMTRPPRDLNCDNVVEFNSEELGSMATSVVVVVLTLSTLTDPVLPLPAVAKFGLARKNKATSAYLYIRISFEGGEI